MCHSENRPTSAVGSAAKRSGAVHSMPQALNNHTFVILVIAQKICIGTAGNVGSLEVGAGIAREQLELKISGDRAQRIEETGSDCAYSAQRLGVRRAWRILRHIDESDCRYSVHQCANSVAAGIAGIGITSARNP